MSAKIDQKAYLQKYLGGSTDKRKKKKKVVKGKGFKIIDDDIDLTKLQELQGHELDILDQGEDAPQIAGIIDERPEEVIKAELFQSSSKWRVVTQDDGINTKLEVEEIKRNIKEVEKENEVIFGKMFSDSEDEGKNDSDLSPPRKHNNERNHSTKKPNSASDSDFSPPRRKSNNRELTSDKPHRKQEIMYKNPSPKRNKNGDVSNLSPPRKPSSGKSNRRDSDLSPPRKYEGNSSQNKSKSDRRKDRKSRWDSVNDNKKDRSNSISPKRLKLKKHKSRNDESDSDSSSQRKSHKKKRNVSDSDASPPRKQRKEKRHDSPPSKENRSQDYKYSSEVQKQQKHSEKTKDHGHHSRKDSPRNRKNKISKKSDSDSDMSPPRRDKRHKEQNQSDSDLSPPRKYKRNNDSYLSPPRRDKHKDYQNSPPPSNKKMAKTLEGKMAGLQDAKQLRQENDAFRQREEEAYSKLTDDVSGRNAKAVSRKSKRETSEERQKQIEKVEKQKELDEKYKKWGRGLKQIEAQEERVQDYIKEAAKPLARYKDDRDLEGRLKDVERAGDPMLNYIRDRKRERGELAPEKPTYKGNFPPNRLNIRPGYRWDGVDRSNGYEKKFFDQQSKRKALEEDAYKWSTEDL